MMLNFKKILISSLSVSLLLACAKNELPAQSPPTTLPAPAPKTYGALDQWLTTADKSVLFAKQMALPFMDPGVTLDAIKIDSTQKFQEIDGFGFCLTDGSAYLLQNMTAAKRAELLQQLFATSDDHIGISYIRVTIGASDLSDSVYTYDDVPKGQTDKDLVHFSIDKANTELIPLLQEILKINPALKILGSPWSAPSWMKNNGSSKGGSLLPAYYGSYAAYFVKYIQAMKAAGITIDAITPQNEPLNPDNNPSMYMTAVQQADFIKNALGPAFASAGLQTKIIVYDHNADVPDYPLTILRDPQAARYVDGSAFHLYAGKIEALSTVHDEFPQKKIYFTEQYTPNTGSFDGDLSWHIQNLIVGASNNWSSNVIEWNLASDPNLGPHTDGGCTTCLGAITVDGDKITRNPSYYIIAHASKFVRPGSYRIQSSTISNIASVAFLRPDGKKVLIALNTNTQPRSFNIEFKGKVVHSVLGPGAVATYIW